MRTSRHGVYVDHEERIPLCCQSKLEPASVSFADAKTGNIVCRIVLDREMCMDLSKFYRPKKYGQISVWKDFQYEHEYTNQLLQLPQTQAKTHTPELCEEFLQPSTRKMDNKDVCNKTFDFSLIVGLLPLLWIGLKSVRIWKRSERGRGFVEPNIICLTWRD